MKIKINKLKEYGKLPARKHYNDVGADIYAPVTVAIPKGATKAIPLGIGLSLPDGYMANIFTRSSMAKKGIVCEMPPIDPGYTGEIHCVLTNHNERQIVVNEGDRIGQLVVMPIVYADFVEELGDERGDGAFGSTGK